MINRNEKQFFDKLYKFVHEHVNEIYDIYFDEETSQKAAFETDYETDNGLELGDKGYEEYCEMIFKPSASNGNIVINYHALPYRVTCNGITIYQIDSLID